MEPSMFDVLVYVVAVAILIYVAGVVVRAAIEVYATVSSIRGWYREHPARPLPQSRMARVVLWRAR